MAVRLRPFEEADYPAFTALYNRCSSEALESEASLRAFNSSFGDEERLNIVAVQAGELVGAAWAHPDQTGEKRVRLDIIADAAAPGGLAETLYEKALGRLLSEAKTLVVRVREDRKDWLEFYAARGYSELERMWESRLTLAGFDPEPFAGVLARVAQTGIQIKTLSEFPDKKVTQRRLYEAMVELLGDVPFHEPLNIWSFEVWQRRFWEHPSRRPESFFLALDGETIVGVSELRDEVRSGWLGTGLTGVKRAYRRRGIALALKLSAAQYAKDAGFEVVSTQNHTVNRAMLTINEALGFVREPAWIKLGRDFSS